MMDKQSDNWRKLPIWLKCWFVIHLLDFSPDRKVCKRIEIISHVTGFAFCLLGLVNEAALAGGLMMLANAYFFYLLIWQGDNYGIWFDEPDLKSA